MASQSACSFEFEITPDNRVMIISLCGKLDPLAAEELAPQLEEARRLGIRRFVFDMGRLEYLGSLGLRLFVSLHNQVKADGAVVLGNLTPSVRTFLEMTKLNRVLRFYPTRREAIDALDAVATPLPRG